MSEQAWPFLVGRSRTEDHRLVVIPEFMTDPSLASALRASVGNEPMEPGSATLREISDIDGNAVTVVYRVFIARAEDFGIPGTGAITDEHSRQILISEGLVLRRAAPDVLRSGVPQRAMDEAHALVAPVYREFWTAEHHFVRQEGRAFTVSSKDSPRLRLQDEPHVSAAPAIPQQDTEEPKPGDRPQGGPPRYGTSAWAIIVLTSVLALLAAGGISLLAVKILSQPAAPSPAPRDAAETMKGFCSDLRAGDPRAAYSLTTAHFRGRTSQHAFAAELLAQGTSPTQCTYKLPRSNNSTEDATVTVTQRKIPESWTITLTGSASGSWQIAEISHTKAATRKIQQ